MVQEWFVEFDFLLCVHIKTCRDAAGRSGCPSPLRSCCPLVWLWIRKALRSVYKMQDCSDFCITAVYFSETPVFSASCINTASLPRHLSSSCWNLCVGSVFFSGIKKTKAFPGSERLCSLMWCIALSTKIRHKILVSRGRDANNKNASPWIFSGRSPCKTITKLQGIAKKENKGSMGLPSVQPHALGRVSSVLSIFGDWGA